MEISANEFRKMMQSGNITTGKKGRLAFSRKAGAAIGHLLEQEATKENSSGLKPKKKKKVILPKTEAPQLSKMKLWLKASGYDITSELVFAKPRKFRFDIAIPSLMIAIEYEGIFSKKSRHTSLMGYSKDCEKYILAQAHGWEVLRYTAINYKNLLRDIDLFTKSLNS